MGLISKYFRDSELECRCGCKTLNVAPELLILLDKLREALGHAVILTSACRCAKHNTAVGGTSNSAHLTGQAADILCHDGAYRYRLITEALKLFPRIGISKEFIHVDIDTTKKINTIWTY